MPKLFLRDEIQGGRCLLRGRNGLCMRVVRGSTSTRLVGQFVDIDFNDAGLPEIEDLDA
jgi:hypothetical protein